MPFTRFTPGLSHYTKRINHYTKRVQSTTDSYLFGRSAYITAVPEYQSEGTGAGVVAGHFGVLFLGVGKNRQVADSVSYIGKTESESVKEKTT